MTLAGEDPIIYKGAIPPPKTAIEKKQFTEKIEQRIKKLNA